MYITEVLGARGLGRFVDEGVLGRLGLFIEGIEVTQATQFYEAADHLTDPADRQANNAVRLVSGKPAWVRVYLGSLFGASGVSGTLEVRRRYHGFLWSTVATLSPHGSSTAAVPPFLSTSYASTRGSVGATLNFIIPAEHMIGTLRLVARVSTGERMAQKTIDVAVTLRQTLRLAGVMISYNGPASMAQGAPTINLAAPTLADLQAMAGVALTLFPVQSTASFRIAGTLNQTNHLQDATFPASGCGAEWDALHARVANVRTADGNRPGWIYYGLLPAGTPMGPVGGCGGGGVAVGPVNQPWTLAHEAGHAAGLRHAPSGGAPNPDPGFPAYEPYDPANTAQGRIGEYGLDVNNGAVKSPQTFFDVMGYAGPQWISPHHYGKLISNAVLNPTTVGIDFPWWKDLVWEELQRWPRIPLPDPPPFDSLDLPVYPPSAPEQVISLIVQLDRGAVTDVKVARTRAHTSLAGAEAVDLSARLLDAEGRVLASGRLMRLTTSPGGCCGGDSQEPPARYVAQAFLPDVATGAMLEIESPDQVIWRREAPSAPPKVSVSKPRVDDEGRASIEWKSSGEVLEFWLRWSRDGETWQSVATDLTETRVRLEAGRLPAGDGFVQVVAHDGFHSTASTAARIRVPVLPADVAILHPVGGRSYPAGQELRLWASVVGAGPEAAEGAVWSIDGTDVASGLDAWVSLEPGEHRITVRAAGGEAGVTVNAERIAIEG